MEVFGRRQMKKVSVSCPAMCGAYLAMPPKFEANLPQSTKHVV